MHFNFKKEVTIKINSSDFVNVDIMFQRDRNDQLQSIIYFFFKILFVKYNYEIYNKELLFIIRVFKK